jgi:zinc D-Ala-D-Ala carboxypeptidase
MTPHFTLAELTHTSHRQFDNTPNETELANLQKLAEFLEQVKTLLDGKPIMINSAFRGQGRQRQRRQQGHRPSTVWATRLTSECPA